MHSGEITAHSTSTFAQSGEAYFVSGAATGYNGQMPVPQIVAPQPTQASQLFGSNPSRLDSNYLQAQMPSPGASDISPTDSLSSTGLSEQAISPMGQVSPTFQRLQTGFRAAVGQVMGGQVSESGGFYRNSNQDAPAITFG
jgi:hypothetical protein